VTRVMPRVSSSTSAACEPPRNQKFMYGEVADAGRACRRGSRRRWSASACSSQGLRAPRAAHQGRCGFSASRLNACPDSFVRSSMNA
jgi:hypothetical protein